MKQIVGIFDELCIGNATKEQIQKMVNDKPIWPCKYAYFINDSVLYTDDYKEAKEKGGGRVIYRDNDAFYDSL